MFFIYFLNKFGSVNNFDSLIVKAKYFYLKPLFKNIGRRVNIQPNVQIEGFHNISIGDNSGIGQRSHITANDIIEIGENVMIGPQLIMTTSIHGISKEKNMIDLPVTSKPIKIGDNVWIGARVTILPGTTIGNNVVIAAGAVVAEDCSSNGLYGGVPSRIIKRIES